MVGPLEEDVGLGVLQGEGGGVVKQVVGAGARGTGRGGPRGEDINKWGGGGLSRLNLTYTQNPEEEEK